MKTLTADEGLATALHHHLLSRPGSSIAAIATGLVGLHNTNPVSPYLSIRARLPGFRHTDLDKLMWDSWHLVRLRAMRLTIFVFPHDLLEVAAAATRHISEPLAARWLRDSGLSPGEFDALAASVDEALTDGPLTVRALRQALDVPREIDLPGVVGRMCDAGLLAGGAPPRSWRSSIRAYHRWEDVLPEVDLQRWDPDVAITELIDRYIQNYGPVTLDDISWWTGFTKARSRAAIEALGTRVAGVAVEGWPGPLYRAGGGVPANVGNPTVTALPLLDPYVQGYRDRARFLDPARHDFVYDGGGNSTATLIRRGRIMGVWQFVDEPVELVRYHLFDAVPAAVRSSAEADLAAAGELYYGHPVDVEVAAKMKPLTADGGRSAAHPLDSRRHRASRR